MTLVTGTEVEWEQVLLDRLALYGHRNWIVVADSAYPAQSQPGIETIAASADQLSVVKTVLNAICNSSHVKANVYTDQELRHVEERDAPGVFEYRRQLAPLLAKFNGNELPHEEIIAKLDQAARMFNVLIVKTDMTIPYTSVFFELDCAYWNSDAEKRLRTALRDSAKS